MRRSTLLSLFAALSLMSAPVMAADIGKAAPDFTATDSAGKSVSLSQFKGKNVVLEWHNPECPFVLKFYSKGDMQKLQKEAVAGGTVWLTINSGAEDKQGSLTQEKAAEYVQKNGLAASHYLLDPKGEIGKRYGAKTTPHMYVINKDGVLVYAGAIDDKPSTFQSDIAGAKNYITAALADLKAGKTVTTASTQPYGCSVKYAD